MYFGYVIGGEEPKIDIPQMDVIMKWPMPTNTSKIKIVFRETLYMRKFIVSFLVVVMSIHAITTSGNIFQWEKGQHRALEELNKNINQASVLALPNL